MKEVGILLKVGQTGLENLQKLTDGLNSAGIETKALDGKAAELSAELKRLADEQALIDAFKRQKTATADAAAAMDAAKVAAGALGRELSTVEAPTKAQTTAFEKAKAAARAADDAYGQQRLALQQLRPQMAAAGLSADALASAQTRINRESAALRSEIQATTGWAQRLAAAEGQAATQATAGASASRQAASGIRDQGDAAQQTAGKLTEVAAAARSLAGIGIAGVLGSQTVQLLKGVTETADQFANLQARIKLVTGEGPAFTSAMDGIARVALGTSSNLETTGNLFSKLASAGKEMGIGQEAALRLTETVNQAVQLSGASAQASDAAITQLVQGLQGGVLRGDEFNSVMEQAPRLAKALADGLGVTTGQLRKMAEAGELSSATVIKALQGQSATLRKEFDSLPQTVGRSIENLRTKWTLFVGDLDKSSGSTSLVAKGINGIADNLQSLVGVAERAGAVLLASMAVQGVSSLRALAAELGTTGTLVGALTRRLDQVPKVINIAVAVTGFELGYQLGKWLEENSELARTLGVGITEFFVGLVNDLQFVKEAATAIFTDDTIAASFDRYKERAEQQRAIFQGLYDDAKKSPEVLRAAAAAAKAETEGLSTAAQQTGAAVAAAGQGGAQSLGALGAAAGQAGAAVAQAGGSGVAGLQATGKAAGDAKTAIADLAATATQVTPAMAASAQQQANEMAKVVSASRQAAAVFRTELPEALAKLNGPELENFRLQVTRAFQAAEQGSRALAAQLANDGKANGVALAAADRSARLLQTTLTEVGRQAAQSLGVDVEAASTRMSAGFVKAEQNLATLLKTLPQLKAAGVDTGQVVGAALSNMIDAAKNQADLDVVISRVKALGATGRISGTQLTGALEQARDKARELREALDDANPGIQSLGEAARRAGVEVAYLTTGVRDGFKAGVTSVVDLVNQIVKSGVEASKASPLLAEALNKQAEAAGTKQEVELVRKALDAARASGKLFGDDAAAALEKVNAKAKDLQGQIAKVFQDQQRYQQLLADSAAYGLGASGGLGNLGGSQAARNAGVTSLYDPASGRYNAAGMRLDANGQVETNTNQFKPPDDSGDWVFDAAGYQKAANAAARWGAGAPSANYIASQFWVRTGSAMATGSSAGTGSVSSASGNRTITLRLGSASTAVTVGSDADANALEAFLSQLETAAARAS